MSLVLSVDDITTGQYVTVHSAVRAPKQPICSGNSSLASTVGEIQMGMPLLVKAISFPYIACGVISIEGDELGPVVVDVRKIRVCVLSGEYVTALTTSKRKPVHRRYDSDEVPF